MLSLRPKNYLGITLIAAVLLCSGTALTQTAVSTSSDRPAGPPPGTQLFPSNANGEVTSPLLNYWDGVDNNNNLHVLTSTFPVLNDVGRMANTLFSPSVNFVDMNNDGLKDLVVGDTYGFLWIYFNSGEKGKPVFTTATLIPTFIGWASKIHVTDWDGDGDNDIIIGTFYGDVVVLENTGGAHLPRFTRSMGVPRYVKPGYAVDDPTARLPQLMLGKQPMLLGIYMSPWVTDWNKDHKPELLLGEGSYSANSIRIVFNQGSRSRPDFKPDRVFYLAYGEGFEQLTPSILDYNGDGVPDLMCGTRTGHIRLYKGNTKSIESADMLATLKGTKAPAALEFDRFLQIAKKDVFDTMSNPFPCDWNEDGLVDILLGSTKGMLYIALNKGTKKEPSFPTIEPIKGIDTDKDLLAPANWWNGIGHSSIPELGIEDTIGDRCNAAVLLSVEKEINLKSSLQPIRPLAGQYFMYFRYVKDYLGWTRNPKSSAINTIGGRLIGCGRALPMVIGQRYEFSFSYIQIGGAVNCRLTAQEHFPGTHTTPPYSQRREIQENLAPAGSWQKKTITFICPGTQQGTALNFYLTFLLPAGDSQFCLDDFSLQEVVSFDRR